ncbi:MAG: type II toxin-antitoxin system RelE family toxin [Ruminiclostridium sp.]
MTVERRFDVRLDPDALKEYNKLDNSILEFVNNQIDELEFRADEVGKILENKNSTKLAGCKEIKLRDAGIRIIFRVTNEIVEVLQIVYIMTIEKRSRDYVFKVAHERNKQFRHFKGDTLKNYLVKTPEWASKKKPTKKKNKSTNKRDDN